MTGNIDDSAATFDNVPALFTDTPARGSSTESNPNEGEMNAPLLALANRTKNLYNQVNGRVNQGVKTTDSPTFAGVVATTVTAPTINSSTVNATTEDDDGSLTGDIIEANVSVETPLLLVSGFSSLGNSDSKIKAKLYTGTTAASTTLIDITSALASDGIGINKIITFDVAIATLPDTDNTIAFSDSPTFPYRRYAYNGLVGVSGSDIGLQDRPYRILIIYME